MDTIGHKPTLTDIDHREESLESSNYGRDIKITSYIYATKIQTQNTSNEFKKMNTIFVYTWSK